MNHLNELKWIRLAFATG